MVSILLLLIFVPVALYLTEKVYQPAHPGMKSLLLDSLHRISGSQNQIQGRLNRCLVFLSFTCCLFSLLILPKFAESLSQRSYTLFEWPVLIVSDFAPIIYLGLILILHLAGELCLAITEQKQPVSLLRNSYFWLPLMLSWLAVAYYLPLEPGAMMISSTRVATSSLWLVVLQPLGSLALILSLLGPYLIVSPTRYYREKPVCHWIRELRMLVSLLVIVLTIVSSRTCFSAAEVLDTPLAITQVAALPLLFLVLLLFVIRLKKYFYAQGGMVAKSLWKRTLWLSLISLTASFLAFPVLGRGDPMMHLLLNFSLLAIWGGFIYPKFQNNPSTIIQK